jgi:hypothetical protein
MSGTAAALHTDQDGSSHTSTPSTPRQHQSSIVQPPLPPQPHYDVADFAKLYTATHSGQVCVHFFRLYTRILVQGDAPGSSSTGGSSSATAPLNDPLKNLSILSQEAGMNAGASAVGAQTSFLYIQLQAQLAAYQSSTAQNYAAAGYPGYHWPNYSTAANASAVAASQFAAAAGWHSMAAAGTYGMYPGWMGPRPGGRCWLNLLLGGCGRVRGPCVLQLSPNTFVTNPDNLDRVRSHCDHRLHVFTQKAHDTSVCVHLLPVLRNAAARGRALSCPSTLTISMCARYFATRLNGRSL